MTGGLNCYLDRFEGAMAVLLIDGREVPVPRSSLPADAAEGDHFHISFTPDRSRREDTARSVSRTREKLEHGDGER